MRYELTRRGNIRVMGFDSAWNVVSVEIGGRLVLTGPRVEKWERTLTREEEIGVCEWVERIQREDANDNRELL